MITIPNDPTLTHHDMLVVLDKISFKLEFRWNVRESAWYMHVYTAAGALVIGGMKIVIGWYLGFRSTNPSRPPGLFLAVDTESDNVPPGISDLGERVKLFYFEKSDLDQVVFDSPDPVVVTGPL